MLGRLKSASFAALDRIGLSRRLGRSLWRRQRLLILCYHGVSLADEHEWSPGLYVPPSHLDARLALLRKYHCTVLPLAEAVQRLYAGDLPERAVALTFDDGYYDFQARAWPLLKRYGLPATVYLTTGRVDRPLPIVNLMLSYALWLARERGFDPRGLFGLRDRSPLTTESDRAAVNQRVRTAFAERRAPGQRPDDMVRLVVDCLGLDYATLIERRLMTLLRPDEVSHLAREGVDFQLHTHQHRTPADPDEFVQSVVTNRDRIQAMTGIRAVHLCYPSGNYRQAYLPALERLGIVSATTCDPGLASRASHPLLLPRFIDTGTIPPAVFQAWLTGLADRLPRRTRRGGDAERPQRVSPVARVPGPNAAA